VQLVHSTVEWVGPDEQDPSTLEIRLAPASGLASPSLRIARDQVDSFLAIIGLAKEEELVGRPVQVTVDEAEGTERIAFLTRPEPVDEPAEETADKPAEASEPVVLSPDGPTPATQGTPVMAGPAFADEVTVYDGVDNGPALPTVSDDECVESAASLSPAEQAIEDRTRADLAAAETVSLDQRYFLYRETYGRETRQTVIELTPEEFSLLGGPGTYLHLDDCKVVGTQNLSPDTAQGIERLLERTTTRPEARLPRAELERLVAAGRVVSCAVY
jgi:hypothetical protein